MSTADISEGFQFVNEVDEEAVLRMPTVHMHSMADAGLHLHQKMLDEYCKKGSTMLIEWDGARRIPIKSKDAEPLMGALSMT